LGYGTALTLAPEINVESIGRRQRAGGLWLMVGVFVIGQLNGTGGRGASGAFMYA